MRRELLFTLLGFLGGFVVAGIVFWQTSVPEAGATPHSPDAAAVHRETSAGGGGDSEHRRRPLVVAAGENAVSAPVAEPQAKSMAEVFHETMGTLADMDQNKRQKAIETLVKQLRAAGPEGLQVMRDFFHAGHDVKLQGGYAMVNGKVTQTPSLRSSLLNALGEWDGKEALDLTREILQTTPRMFEASMAISQLEKKAPGVYREEAIRTLQQLAAAPPEKDASDGGKALFDAMKYFKASELVPAAEASAAKNPWSTLQFAQALDAMPSDVRTAALQRLFANENVVRNLSTNPWMLQGLNYSEPVVAQNVAQVFADNTDKKFRENFLTNFSSQQRQVYYGASGIGSTQTPSTAERVTQLQGKLSFLDQIAPQCTTPVLQERLQDARAEVQKAIANPEDNGLTKRGSGTLILKSDANVSSGWTTVITSDAIQLSTTTDKK